MKVLITGSGGLVGSECSRLFCAEGWTVVGIDNDMRRRFFGEDATTRPTIEELGASLPRYRHYDLDVRDRSGIRKAFELERPDLIIHTAGQPSHDRAASIPYEDFDVNAVGTMNILVAARDFCRESPLCYLSTNKVYGDRPNDLRLLELETRYDYADGRAGIDESMPIDACLHSIMGASKAAADLMCQEFGRYFQMPIGIFRAGCITGPQHTAVEPHGYLAFLVSCAVAGRGYTIHGYKGKQVRDQIHCCDVARLFGEFFQHPTCGEVYNLGGGRKNSLSILETIRLLADARCPLQYRYSDVNRLGDHICYISDLSKVHADFPAWGMEYDLDRILSEILEHRLSKVSA